MKILKRKLALEWLTLYAYNCGIYFYRCASSLHICNISLMITHIQHEASSCSRTLDRKGSHACEGTAEHSLVFALVLTVRAAVPTQQGGARAGAARGLPRDSVQVAAAATPAGCARQGVNSRGGASLWQHQLNTLM